MTARADAYLHASRAASVAARALARAARHAEAAEAAEAAARAVYRAGVDTADDGSIVVAEAVDLGPADDVSYAIFNAAADAAIAAISDLDAAIAALDAAVAADAAAAAAALDAARVEVEQ